MFINFLYKSNQFKAQIEEIGNKYNDVIQSLRNEINDKNAEKTVQNKSINFLKLF